jgi:hypothetical protein
MNVLDPRNRNALLVLAAVALLALSAFGLAGGCTPAQVESLKAVRADTTTALTEANAAIRTLESELSALPPGDPVRTTLEPRLADMRRLVAELERRVPLLDGAIASAERGELDPALAKELRELPVVGPYVGLIIAGGTLAFGLWQRGTATRWRKALAQFAKGFDNAVPTPSEAQRLALAAELDEDSKVLVARAKKGQ